MKFYSTLFFLFFLSACNKDQSHDASYYQSNDLQRKNKIEECNQNSTELKQTNNCINAFTAEHNKMFDDMQKAIKSE